MSTVHRIKYPRTPHLPWSEKCTDDDKIIDNVDNFCNTTVVVTLKMDGECTTIYPDGYVHARSINSRSHSTRDWVKSMAAQVAFKIPENHRVVGENLFAKHSIEYKKLDSYFYMFSMIEDDIVHSWEYITNFHLYNFSNDFALVPVIYHGLFDKEAIHKAFEPHRKDHEGYVIRDDKSFSINEFPLKIAKFVKKDFTVGNEHWMYSRNCTEKNTLKRKV